MLCICIQEVITCRCHSTVKLRLDGFLVPQDEEVSILSLKHPICLSRDLHLWQKNSVCEQGRTWNSYFCNLILKNLVLLSSVRSICWMPSTNASEEGKAWKQQTNPAEKCGKLLWMEAWNISMKALAWPKYAQVSFYTAMHWFSDSILAQKPKDDNGHRTS